MSLESFWRIKPQQHRLCLSPCMPSPCPAAMALVCKGFQCFPLVDCNCPGSASNRRKNVKKKKKRILQRSWALCLGGDLMAIMTSEVCLAWFRFTELPLTKDILSGPKTSVNTPVQKHILEPCSYKHTPLSHVNSYVLLLGDMGSAPVVNLLVLFISLLSLSHSSDAPAHS